MTKLKKTVPWIVAAGIFAYLFYIYPPSKIWEALQYVRLSSFAPFAFGYFLFVYFVDVVSLSQVLKRFGFGVSIRELIPARGVTYLLFVLNYAAGQAGFAYYLKRTHQMPIWEALSIFFFMAVIDLYWVITLAAAGSFFQEYRFAGIELRGFVWLMASLAYLAFALNYLFWRGPLYKKMERGNGRIFRWIRTKDIFRIFKEASFVDYLKLALLRLPIHIALITSMYVVFQTFGVFAPFVNILGNIPLVTLVGIIPITPSGMGTSNAALVELLTPYLTSPIFSQGTVTASELLFAASLLWMFSNFFFKVLTGLFCLQKVSLKLFSSPPQTKPMTPSPLGDIPPL